MVKLSEDVDWVAGEEIVITSTELGVDDNEEPGVGDFSEQRMIISTNGRTLYIDRPLTWDHQGETEKYPDANGSDFIDLYAEVALITRNVKFQGDPETSLTE